MAEGATVGLPLPAGVVELHPELRPPGATNVRPITKALQLAVVLQCYAAGAGHGAAVDHHIAGQQQAGTALGPGPVEAQQLIGGALVGSGQVLLHGSLGNAVGKGGAVGQLQGLEGDHDGLRYGRWSETKVKVNFKVNSSRS